MPMTALPSATALTISDPVLQSTAFRAKADMTSQGSSVSIYVLQ
jgi:hypothetical protein